MDYDDTVLENEDVESENDGDKIETDIELDTAKKVYTPAEVKELIQTASNKAAKAVTAKERSKAEKQLQDISDTYADYDDLKAISKSLADYGYKGDTKAQREAIEKMVSEDIKSNELEALQDEAEIAGVTPEFLAEQKRLKKEIEEIKKEKQAAQEKANNEIKQQQIFNKQMSELETAYPGITYDKLMSDSKFTKFEKTVDRKLTWKQVYESYKDVVGDAEATAIKNIKSKINRTTSSGKERYDSAATTHGLSDDEIAWVDEWNNRYPKEKMTYNEFSKRKTKR